MWRTYGRTDRGRPCARDACASKKEQMNEFEMWFCSPSHSNWIFCHSSHILLVSPEKEFPKQRFNHRPICFSNLKIMHKFGLKLHSIMRCMSLTRCQAEHEHKDQHFNRGISIHKNWQRPLLWMSVCLSVFLCVSLRCLFLCSAVPVWVPWYIYLSKVSGCLCVSVGLSVRGVSLCVFPSARPFLLPPNISPLFHTLTTGGYFRPVMVHSTTPAFMLLLNKRTSHLKENNCPLVCPTLASPHFWGANIHKWWMLINYDLVYN